MLVLCYEYSQLTERASTVLAVVPRTGHYGPPESPAPSPLFPCLLDDIGYNEPMNPKSIFIPAGFPTLSPSDVGFVCGVLASNTSNHVTSKDIQFVAETLAQDNPTPKRISALIPHFERLQRLLPYIQANEH